MLREALFKWTNTIHMLAFTKLAVHYKWLYLDFANTVWTYLILKSAGLNTSKMFWLVHVLSSLNSVEPLWFVFLCDLVCTENLCNNSNNNNNNNRTCFSVQSCIDAQNVQWWTKMCSDDRLFLQWWIKGDWVERLKKCDKYPCLLGE